ncbi:glucosamine-6-phosphate deaminase [Aeoliella sp.]|uniref:glucosamine-6-phosphate deaminase n=1 Tax=Aeoliella sp. TaxID=2795800 RepID=UPI003CCC33E6
MQVSISPDAATMAKAAAQHGAELVRQAINERGQANIIVATGASQLGMLSNLVAMDDIDWQCVTGFHLDEYIDLPFRHKGSFRGYLWSNFVSQLPVPLRAFHYLSGEQDAPQECKRVGEILKQHPVDVAFVGIGENGHLAFNDPPADFETEEPYLCVALDEACRQQQTGEGWFATLDDVPTHAITMSIKQILKTNHIVCTVPDERKAQAVRNALEGPVTSTVPASILQQHEATTLFLDAPAASQLEKSY